MKKILLSILILLAFVKVEAQAKKVQQVKKDKQERITIKKPRIAVRVSTGILIDSIVVTDKTMVYFKFYPFRTGPDPKLCIRKGYIIKDYKNPKKIYKLVKSPQIPICGGGKHPMEFDRKQKFITYALQFEKLGTGVDKINFEFAQGMKRDNNHLLFGVSLAREKMFVIKSKENIKIAVRKYMVANLLPQKKIIESEVQQFKKGEFETTEKFNARRSVKLKEAKKELKQEAISMQKIILDSVFGIFDKSLDWKIEKMTYNADKQFFNLKIKGFHSPVVLKVPLEKAKTFKEKSSELVFRNKKYVIFNDKITMISFELGTKVLGFYKWNDEYKSIYLKYQTKLKPESKFTTLQVN